MKKRNVNQSLSSYEVSTFCTIPKGNAIPVRMPNNQQISCVCNFIFSYNPGFIVPVNYIHQYYIYFSDRPSVLLLYVYLLQ